MKETLLETTELKHRIRKAFQYTLKGEKENSYEIAKKIWREVNSVEEFYDKILSDERMIYNRGFAIVSRLNKRKHFKRIRNMVDPYMIGKIDTPKGVLQIKLNDADMLWPNGTSGSDSIITRLAIIPDNVLWNSFMLPTFITVNGHIEVYDNKENVIASINGRCEISYGFSFIIINKLPNLSISEAEQLQNKKDKSKK